jgi:hypothetical protein
VERLLDQVRLQSRDSASNIADGIYHATRAFVEGDLQDDDITSVVIKANRFPGEAKSQDTIFNELNHVCMGQGPRDFKGNTSALR